ncbi:MAG: citrate/2-methylcitrate synthase [Lachnospiraceae bacterium]|nr:citrate/2-methylcitrate synthase [Lachnospiraceae bacterium]MBR6908855.1 citrate/2-methylcitrate synthase [Lachnospiraceae bacterium]
MADIYSINEHNEMLDFSEMDHIKEEIDSLQQILEGNHRIDKNLYLEYDVKRGLRDAAGKGVLTGLTEISDVVAYDLKDGNQIPCDGRLYYQGVNVVDFIKGLGNRRFGFEETTYLLIFGKLPTKSQLDEFIRVSREFQNLGARFTRDVVMKASNANIMNALQRCVLTLYTYDNNPDDISAKNVLRQSLELINKLPLIAVYSYMSYCHFRKDEALVIRNPKPELSVAENILQMLRPDGKFTELEAKVLDVALILHADHGGGNNSTFTTHVVTSSGTDTYSSIAASIGSLKGFRHGGANLKVQNMFADLYKNIKNLEDEKEVKAYIQKILDKQVFDKQGLVYGMGHAVYTLSDPREVVLKEYAKKLAEEKGRLDDFNFYERVEKIAGKLIMQQKNVHKEVCANVDFYSGLVYSMMGIPEELYTPIFAISRISGWCAHRLEEILNAGKIVRPAYKYVGTHVPYVPISKR